MVASFPKPRVKPVKAVAVEAVSQVKVVVYSLWPKERFPSGEVRAFHFKEVAGTEEVQVGAPVPPETRNWPALPTPVSSKESASE